MNDIPPDRRSTHELYEQFRVAGERKARLDRQVRRRRWIQHVPGPVLGAVAAFLIVGGGLAVGTKVFTSDDGRATVTGPGARGEVRQAPADRRLARAAAADPRVAGARWGLLVYRNTKGATCVAPGRLVGRRVGRVADGQFAAYGTSPGGATCGVAASDPLLLWLRSYPIDGGSRMLLYGIADRSVSALRMGAGTPVRIAPDGTFLVVGVGRRPFHGRTLRVTRGGVTRNVSL